MRAGTWGVLNVVDALIARGVIEHVDLGFFLILVFTKLYFPKRDWVSSRSKVQTRAGGFGLQHRVCRCMYICTYVYIYTTGVHLVLAAVFSLVVKNMKFGSKYCYELSARQAEGVSRVSRAVLSPFSCRKKPNKVCQVKCLVKETVEGSCCINKWVVPVGELCCLERKSNLLLPRSSLLERVYTGTVWCVCTVRSGCAIYGARRLDF